MFDHFMVIFEEYGQGDGDCKRAAAEIFLNGGTPPHYLPPGSIRVASTNTGARYGVSKDYLFSIARRTLIEVTGDVDVLVNHLDKPYTYQGETWNTMPLTKHWAKTHHNVVFEDEPEKDETWCNPRTMCAVDRYLQKKIEMTGKPIDINDGRTMEMMRGTFGMAATQSYFTHMTFSLQLPSMEEVVNDPHGTPVPTKADLQMLMAYTVAGRVDVNTITPCLTYMSRLPRDMGVTFVQALLRRDYKGMINTPAMQGWISRNSALVSIVSSLAHA
jgi:hypothetical protein